jgi:DNA invertase Pin-like site-specific DNA recombinase
MRQRAAGPAAIYARVSTERQAVGDKTSLDRQVKNCRRTAERLGLHIVDDYLVKEAHSASDPDDRPGLEGLYDAAARHAFAYVLMDVIDRTTRAGPFDLVNICKRFLDCGVEPIWAGHPDLDLTTAAGQIEAAKLAIRAFEDKETIARRFQEGKQERLDQGKLLRSSILYGFRWDAERPRGRSYDDEDEDADSDPRTTWVPDDGGDSKHRTADVVRRMYVYLANGYRTHSDASAVKLVDMLTADHIPTPSAVKRMRRKSARWKGKPAEWQVPVVLHIIHNPAYKGERVQMRWEKTRTGLVERDYLRSLLVKTDETWAPDKQIAHYSHLIADLDAEDERTVAEVMRWGGDDAFARLRARAQDDLRAHEVARKQYQAKIDAAHTELARRAMREQRLATVHARAQQHAGSLDDLTPDERRQLILDLGATCWVGRADDHDTPYLALLWDVTEEQSTHVRPQDLFTTSTWRDTAGRTYTSSVSISGPSVLSPDGTLDLTQVEAQNADEQLGTESAILEADPQRATQHTDNASRRHPDRSA